MQKIEKYEIRIVNTVKFGYGIGCYVLYLGALPILFSPVYTVFIEIIYPSFSIYKILDEIALIIFSIAALDVAKYVAIEEFIQRSHIASLYEEKQSLSKFVVIISSASPLFKLVLGIYKKLTNYEDKL